MGCRIGCTAPEIGGAAVNLDN